MNITRSIKEIIIHCSATKHGITTKQIKRYHVNEKGWSDIGYHFVIESDGSIHQGRPINQPGAHCKGHNSKSIGICYIGGRDAKGKLWRINRRQEQALADCINGLFMELGKTVPVKGHNQYNAHKECPCMDPTLLDIWTAERLSQALTAHENR